MKFQLIAVASIGLLAGACSLRPQGTSGVYSSLPADASVSATAHRSAASHNQAITASGFGTATLAPSPRMPGDLTAPIAESKRTGINPVAILTASAQARSQWEALRPGNLNRPPLLQSRLAQAIGVMTGGDISTGSVATGPDKVTKPNRAAKLEDYDRDAAMQRLINGGRTASRHICDGC